MPHITRRTSALAGIVAGPLWVGVVVLLTWLEWDFLHSLHWTVVHSNGVAYPSSTARGRYGLLQVLNFATLGVLGGIFAIGFRREFRRKVAGRVATTAFALFTVAGFLNACKTDLPGEPLTWHGTCHGIGFVATMLSILVMQAASGLALRGNPDWRGWRLLGWLPVILVAIVVTGAGLPGDVSFYVFLGLSFGWFAAMGARLLQLSGEPASDRQALPSAAAPGLL